MSTLSFNIKCYSFHDVFRRFDSICNDNPCIKKQNKKQTQRGIKTKAIANIPQRNVVIIGISELNK